MTWQILSVYYSFHLVHYVTDTQQTNDAALDMAKHDSAYTVAIWFKLRMLMLKLTVK